MKILLIQNTDREFLPMMRVSKGHVLAIQRILPSAEIKIVKDTKNDILEEIKNTDVLITGNLQNVDCRKGEGLKWVHTTSAGIDLAPKELIDSNILLTNSSGVHPIPIAEHVFAFILMFARQLHKSFRIQIIDKEWKRGGVLNKVTEVYKKTIGIVGFGRIGKKIAELSKTFGMKILTFSRHSHYDINDLLKKSDFVVNCLPYTEETHHFFDLNKFKKMKKSAYFINIGRGKSVNEKNLIEALSKNVIAGAGLDVFEEEPLPSTSPLWGLENVILTPHYAGWTPLYMDRVIAIFCENFKAYLKGQRMPNLVDKNRGY